MSERIQLDEAYLELGITIPGGKATCTRCKREHRLFAMSCLADLSEGAKDIACTSCLMDEQREISAAAEKQQEADLIKTAPWETISGVEMKMERNRRIEAARWAVDPLTSPLTDACQAAFVEYIRALNRLTVDFAEPNAVVWPTQPELEYPGA